MPKLATITDNCKRAFANIRVGAGGQISLELYLRGDDVSDDVRHLALQTAPVNFQAFNRRLHGATGAATYESASVPIQLSSEPSKLGRVYIGLSITPSQVKIFNNADEFRFSYLGDDYICNVTIPEYLFQDGLRSYVSQTFAQFTLNQIISMTARQRLVNTMIVSGRSTFPSDFVDIYYVELRGAGTVTNTAGINAIPSPSFHFDLEATDITRQTVMVDIAIGGAKAGNVLTYAVPMTLLPSVAPRPDVPNFEPTTVEIDRVVSEINGQVTVEFTVTPPLTSTSGGLLEMTLSETRPTVRDIGTARTANLLTTSLARAGIERGKSYKVVVAYKAGANMNHFSPPYYFVYGETIRQVSDVDHLIQQVKTAKIFRVGELEAVASFDVIQDIFLSDFVDSLRITNTTASETTVNTFDNPRDSSVIRVSVGELRIGQVSELLLHAITQYGEIEIAQINVKRSPGVTSSATAAAKKTNAVKSALYKAYDADVLSIIEDLPEDCQVRIAEDAIMAENRPENDGQAHDFNKRNKRGSVFSKQNSDLSKTKYAEVIDTAIGDISESVPDINEGSPF